MKKFFILITMVFVILSLVTPVSANSTELGQLKVCKAAGIGVIKGQVFTFSVANTNYIVQAGYCVLAGQFPLTTQVNIQENIPAGYFVENIVIAPSDRTVSKSTALGEAAVKIGAGITEVTFRNATATSTSTKTPVPTTPQGYMQVCKQADGEGVSGYFMFRFAGQSKSVPVDFCSSLVFNLTPGTLTVTEDAQTGYQVSDIYTIPADRLISKDLNARTANVTIVPSNGDASTQTVVVFVNKRVVTAPTETNTNTPTFIPTGTLPTNTSTFTPTGTLPTNTLTSTPTFTPTGTLPTNTPTATSTFTPTGVLPTNTPTNTPTFTPTGTLPTNTPTNTPTFTPTGTLPTNTSTNTPTATPTSCAPIVVTADFSQLALGQSVEGLGVVAPNLNIDAKGTAVKVLPHVEPAAYLSNTIINDHMTSNRGFTDLTTKNAVQPHLYTFTFAPGTSVSNFSLHMLDFGDWNPTDATNHYVSMTAYDAFGNPIAKQELSYTTPPDTLPQSSDLYGNLKITGDASAPAGQPGNWTWNVTGNGIVKVVLEFGAGYDPNIALDLLSFTTECPQQCQPTILTANFSQLALGQSVEGLGVVAPNLNIDAKGTAVKVLPHVEPAAYLSNTIINDHMTSNRGFTDLTTKNAVQPHLYTFTFAPGTSVSNFSLHMLDFGDWNPTDATNHYVSMTAYDAFGNPIAKQELSYTTPPDTLPQSSDLYGNLKITGDASAPAGQPGNWTWNVTGNGIVKVVLEFGAGYDPNIALDLLSFTTECP